MKRDARISGKSATEVKERIEWKKQPLTGRAAARNIKDDISFISSSGSKGRG